MKDNKQKEPFEFPDLTIIAFGTDVLTSSGDKPEPELPIDVDG